LRPLANAHNTHNNSGTKMPLDKKPKAFSVYTDNNKIPNSKISTTTSKRPLESQTIVRPVKVARTNPIARTTELSASKIEELIERKVSEALANRALDQPLANPPTEISDAVQKRLEALEKKIESGEAEETRAEGLRFLLMAKQHKERGEDASALKMYELALPYFPGQRKLQHKIQSLKAKIQAKKETADKTLINEVVRETQRSLATAPIRQLPTPVNSFEIYESEIPCQASKRQVEEDGDYDELGREDDDHDESFENRTPKTRKAKSKSKAKASIQIFKDESDSYDSHQTPRTRHLLDIINSRDVALIQGLAGVGKKKANDLVEFLALQDGDEGGNLITLEQLMRAPGMGSKTVEKAYGGIGAMLVV